MAQIIYDWYKSGVSDRDVVDFESEFFIEVLQARFDKRYRGAGQWRDYWQMNDNPAFNKVWRPAIDGLVSTPKLSSCVFISHKQEDKSEALRAAKWALASGLDVWLDVLNPWLAAATIGPAAPALQSRALAAIIEMGLLNSTHVLAIMTRHTVSSRWVPYEYGRVKSSAAVSQQAASWRIGVRDLPEYQHLGAVFDSPAEVQTWMRSIP